MDNLRADAVNESVYELVKVAEMVGLGTRCWKSLVPDKYTRPAIVVLSVAIL